MTNPSGTSDSSAPTQGIPWQRWALAIALIGVVFYLQRAEQRSAQQPSPKEVAKVDAEAPQTPPERERPAPPAPEPTEERSSESKPGPPSAPSKAANVDEPPKSKAPSPPPPPVKPVTAKPTPPAPTVKPVPTKKDGPALGQLRDAGRGVKVSTAGLRYAPGGPEGHRLEHVLRHAEDQPNRPGKHGVFDGGEAGALAAIDEAYLLIKQKSPQVRTKPEGDRTVYEVNLKRRIGFVGGQDGRRNRNPAATHLRLVLEDEDVVTAFPFKP